MYQWQQNAEKCEVCGSIGHVGHEQASIVKIGLCYTCCPIRREKNSLRVPVGRPGFSKPSVGEKRLSLQERYDWLRE